jgi:DNA-binding transcriptional ArsR family regulator
VRLRLTVHDLARVGLSGADPLFELTSSLQLLQSRESASDFNWWKRWVRHRLPESTRMLAWLCRPGTAVPAFLLPFPGRQDLDAAVAAVRETGVEELRAGVLLAANGRELPGWAAKLADGETSAIVEALRDYFESALGPHWRLIRAQVEADRDRRTQILLNGGVYALLNSLRPAMTWCCPPLTGDSGEDNDVLLHNARLVLLPAFFALSPAVVTGPASQPTRLVYPAGRDSGQAQPVLGTPPSGQRKALADLLGPTRAAALRTMSSGCSTSELATLLGVTPSAISRHTSVLRQAGLINTYRDRNTVLHSLTPLGSTLLES